MDSGLGFVQPMFFVGVVEDRNDPRVEGRVRVRAFGVHGSNQDIPTEELALGNIDHWQPRCQLHTTSIECLGLWIFH
jgi:hypothetical protein